MAFLDKISGVAKNIGDKTSETIERTKLNGKISAEMTAADEDYKEIGKIYYEIYSNGGDVLPEVEQYCQSVKAHLDAAAEAQESIDNLSNKATTTSQPSSGLKCVNCGTSNAPGTKFCQNCGNKLEAPAPEPSGPRKCPQCGCSVDPDVRFCPECGQKME